MSRRRFLTVQELADELRCDVTDVVDQLLAGRLRVLAPPRKEVDIARERGGGIDTLGRYAANGLIDWLREYLAQDPPIADAERARRAARPYTDGTRVYVRADAVAERVRGKFFPNPSSAAITAGLVRANAQRGRALGVDPDQPSGRLLWWRLPPSLTQEVMR